MSKVVIEKQLPSEKIIAKQKAQLKDHVTDAQGRVIKLRMPDALDEFDLHSALGDDSANPGCAAMANAMLYIESINGEPFVHPKSYAQVRSSIQKVGRDGLQAISLALMEYAEQSKLENEQEQRDQIKK